MKNGRKTALFGTSHPGAARSPMHLQDRFSAAEDRKVRAPLILECRMRRACWLLLLCATSTALNRVSIQAQATPTRGDGRSLAPFVATPLDVVERMLTLAGVGPGDVVYDLGCGDGRIVITAAQKFGARGVGVDLDANLINKAETAARSAGVDGRVRFLVQDALTVDVSEATVVTLYLLSASNVTLRPILTRQLRKGSRVVSHSFAMGTWEPDQVDSFRDAAGTSRTLYLWNVDGTFRP
jgi:SAM-dependent methyltransferase